jgi:murein DD-endopeptidase MepM/ murein hydrolase activator NlpD
MRRTGVFLAGLVALCALAPSAGAQTFTVVKPHAPHAQTVPSYDQPNGPGAITLPVALSAPPAQPAVLSYDQLLGLWQRAGAAYGVPWQVLAAINKIESNFGRNMGPSSAGAIGWMQFMPSTWLRWGMDANGDGIADPWDPEDAVFSAGRYLAAAGAHDDLARSIFAYNHAQWYVDEVLALASEFESGNGDFAAGMGESSAGFRLDALRAQQDEARRAVTQAQRSIPRAETSIGRLARKKLVLVRKVGDAKLSTPKFERLEGRIARIERHEARASALLDRRRADLDAAVAALQGLDDQVAAAAVAAPAAAASSAPGSVAGYVFPVGGGPSVVSVAHDHHDYPAADIAAPEGSPLFALADSFVVDTYADGSGNCGIGFRIQLETGTEYTYCHLSYLEPDVHPGAALAAGQPVGLVGQTGHATGPHLHLQLDPAVSYPQNEAWFKSFAGVAFSWQDAPTPRRALPKPRGRVFTVVRGGGDPFSDGVITFTR